MRQTVRSRGYISSRLLHGRRWLRQAVAITMLLAAPALGDGACCLSDGACLPTQDEVECGIAGGVFLDGADCSSDPCGIGACCAGDVCTTATAFDCITAGRDFAGGGTSCDDDPCGIGVGACCIDGGCLLVEPLECDALGGSFLGVGTPCFTEPCTLGACCLEDGTCFDGVGHECDTAGGTLVPNASCDEGACATPEDCPPGTLFGQRRSRPDDFIAGSSEAKSPFHRFDDFQGVPGAIEAIVFHGLEMSFDGSVFEPCIEPDPSFEIRFLHDAGGIPGSVVATFVLDAARVNTGIGYLGVPLQEYTVVLPEPVVLVDGWISIVGSGSDDCWFLWMSAQDGNGYSWCDACLPSEQDFDLSFCFQGVPGGVEGACCVQATGVCTEGVDILDCLAPGTRFLPGGTCADLEPPCGVLLGACCIDEGACVLTDPEACTDLGGDWLGDGSICASCPCAVPCPPGSTVEGEPVCYDDYIDDFNGGCTAPTDPTFSPIEPGATVCGTSGIHLLDGEEFPDLDWYIFTLEQPTTVTWTVDAEFRARTAIVDLSAGCPGVAFVVEQTLECTTNTISALMPAGDIAVVVFPGAFTDSSMCGAGYTATLTIDGSCPEDLDGSGAVDIGDLLAVLAAWGPCGAPCPEDLDASGAVDVGDLLAVLGAWGSCP